MLSHGFIRTLAQPSRSPCVCPFATKNLRGTRSSSRGQKAQVGKQRRDNKRVLNDYYFKEAKRTNYLSRAAFKLLQVNEKFNVFRKHGTVLDLGCFPGAWLQVSCQQIGPLAGGGRVVGIDLKEMSVPTAYCDERVTVLHGDARDLSRRALAEYSPGGFHTVLSDMCHNTTGSDVADVGLSLELCECAAQIAIGNAFRVTDADLEMMPDAAAAELRSWERGVLSTGGALVMKILEGSGTKEFSDSLRPYFTKVGFLRPKATRQESREVYIVCTGRK